MTANLNVFGADSLDAIIERRQKFHRQSEARPSVFVNGIGWTNNPPVRAPGSPMVGVVIHGKVFHKVDQSDVVSATLAALIAQPETLRAAEMLP